MKKHFLFFFLFLSALTARAQCPTGDVYLTSQAEVDNFGISYPGCTDLDSYLFIYSDDIVNLNGLANLTSVSTLYIGENKALKDLTGLINLTYIRRNFEVINNTVLSDLNGLAKLKAVEGRFYITGNTAITSLSGLTKLTSIDRITIENNSSLKNLEGLANLTSVNGYVEIYDNPLLTDLSGLENLSEIEDLLYIGGNDALSSLAALANLKTLVGGLDIFSNNSLTSLSGLENLSSIGDSDGGGLYIHSNNSLTSLNDLANLSSIGGTLSIHGNNSLTSLAGLTKLTSIGDGLEITDNPLLSTCAITSVCTYLSSPDAVVTISGNAPGCFSETNVRNICNGTTCPPPGDLYFHDQASVDAFIINYPTCTTVDGSLNIMFFSEVPDPNGLKNLDGLANLVSVGGNVVLDGTYVTDLTGLRNLKSIGGYLQISYNPLLSDLTGLANLKSIGSDLSIFYNNSLSTCTIQSICAYLANPAGILDIASNATGCASEEEVQAACTAFPVTLISFEAAMEGDEINLLWSTAAEMNSSHFDIEHSLNAKNWQSMGSVISQGESSTIHQYTFKDKSPANGENFYRLRMIDRDSSFTYSRIRNLRIDLPLAIYPNPVADRLHLKGEEWSSIKRVKIFDLSGRLMHEAGKVSESGIEVRHLPAGLYNVELIQTGGISTFKIIKD